MKANQDDILERARKLLGGKVPKRKSVGTVAAKQLTGAAKAVLERQQVGLDIYLAFDATASMRSYIDIVTQNLGEVTDALLGGSNHRISINIVRGHNAGEQCLELYGLTSDPVKIRGCLEHVENIASQDYAAAYECLMRTLAKSIPQQSHGRRRVIQLIADSLPHGMSAEYEDPFYDGGCWEGIDYKDAFRAVKLVADGFYFVGCDPVYYDIQRHLIDPTKPDREQFIELGDMVEVTPALITALAKKTESAKALANYMQQLESKVPDSARKIRGLLGK